MADTTSHICKSSEPFYLSGHGERADRLVMMIHGFTGSPSEFRRFGYYLNEQGYTVRAICLPGHGTHPEHMPDTRWPHWWMHVLSEYDRLQQNGYESCFVIGHALGGLLALKLSLYRRVDGLVSLAAPIFLADRRVGLAPLLQFFIRDLKKPAYDADDQMQGDARANSRIPIAGVVSLLKLLKRVKQVLPQVSVPLLIVQGGRDLTVQPQSSVYIYDTVGSKHKEIRHYPLSSHALLQDCEREQVYTDIKQFLQAQCTLSNARPDAYDADACETAFCRKAYDSAVDRDAGEAARPY